MKALLFDPGVGRLHRALLPLMLGAATAFGQFTDFVKVKDDKLMDGGRELRFISVNIPNLHYIEDNLPFECTNPWRLPDEFEIRDALGAVKQLGGKVARIYVFSVRKQDDTPDIIRHVLGPGEFNEEAFRTFDKVLQMANEVGIRLIIPFVDNWHWWGGPKEYAAFRGKARDDFWTDPQLIEDFKKTIAFVINRTNTLTGVPYKEDKAILSWETGNELAPPFSWTKEIAAYVKSLDTNHLLTEGIISPQLSEEALDDPNIDILSTHHYRNPVNSLEWIVKNQQLARGKKPYIIGEYGIIPTEDLRILTDTIINQGLAGGMIWSLRFRDRDGGFYYHYEYSNIGAYRWPGFTNGDFYDERLVLSLLREKASQIDGTTPPRLAPPAPPTLLPISSSAEISWKGSVGATSYIVERRNDHDSSWTVVADSVDESRYQYRPLFNDETVQIGQKYFYRVKARNTSGVSDYSIFMGPIEITSKKSVDEMENFDRVYQKDGTFQVLTYQDIRRAKEDRSRLTGTNGSYVVYEVRDSLDTVLVDAYSPDADRDLDISTSTDGVSFTKSKPQKTAYIFGRNDYRYYTALTFRLTGIAAGTSYIKIALDGTLQIGRIEFTYR